MSKGRTLLDELLSVQDLKTKEITVKEWGDKKITIRELPAKAVNDLVMVEDISTLDQAVGTVIAGVIDEDGEQVFSNEHAETLSNKSQSALAFISTEILKLSGLIKENKKDNKNDKKK